MFLQRNGKRFIVTIIIPTFNRLHYLKEALNSVLNQSYKQFEIIVVDDGSSDGTGAWLSSLNNVAVTSIILPVNRGRSHARNVGLRSARGEFLVFLDSDDLFLSKKLEMQVAFLRHHEDLSAVASYSVFIGDFGEVTGELGLHRRDRLRLSDVEGYTKETVLLPSVMFRREILRYVGQFNEGLNRFEDTDFWSRVASYKPIGLLKAATVKVRTHSGNSLPNPDETFFEIMKYVHAVRQRSPFFSFNLSQRCRMGKLFLHYYKAYELEGRNQDIRQYPLAAFRLAPWVPLAFLLWARVKYPPADRLKIFSVFSRLRRRIFSDR